MTGRRTLGSAGRLLLREKLEVAEESPGSAGRLSQDGDLRGWVPLPEEPEREEDTT